MEKKLLRKYNVNLDKKSKFGNYSAEFSGREDGEVQRPRRQREQPTQLAPGGLPRNQQQPGESSGNEPKVVLMLLSLLQSQTCDFCSNLLARLEGVDRVYAHTRDY